MTTSGQDTKRLKIHSDLLTAFWAVWSEHRDANPGTDPVLYSRISIVTATQLAAVTAVDVGMDEEQFINTCKANFREAHKRAPRFGA